MKNINNNLIFSLGVIGLLAFTVILFPISANAYVTKGAYTYCDGPCDANSNGFGNNGSGSNGNGSNNGNNPYGNGNFNPNVLDKNAVPTVYGTDPLELGTADKAKSISVFGTGFKPDSIARWNSQDRPTTFVNANKVIMHLDPEDTATEGKYQVSVVTPSPEGGKFSNPKVVNVLKGSVLGKVASATTKAVSSAAGAVKGATTTNGSNSKNTSVASSNSSKSTTVASKDASNSKTTGEKVASATSSASDKLKGNLVGAVINGDNSVMPNSVIEWLVLFALILFSVLLFRKLWLTPADHAKPLKHA